MKLNNVNVDSIVDEFADKLRDKVSNHLVSVILFGSRVRESRWDSDVDVLVVADGLPADLEARYNLFFEVEYELSIKYGVSISSFYFTPREVEYGAEVKDRLLLGVLLGYKVFYDRGTFFGRVISKLKNDLMIEKAKFISEDKVWFVPSLRATL